MNGPAQRPAGNPLASAGGAGDERTFAAGAIIFAEGQPSDYAYVILSGRVFLNKASSEGPMRLATLGPGEMFGEMGILDGSVRSATATAGDITVLRALERGQLFAILAQHPETAVDMVKAVARRLRHTNALVGAPDLARLAPPRKPLVARLREFFLPAPLDLDQVRIEFQPDAIEIEERPIPGGARALLYAILALILTGTLWATVAKTDLIVVAAGRIATTDAKIVVQPISTATIRAINVLPGQVVQKDQVLVSLDPTFAVADERSVRSQMTSSAAEIARLQAELALAGREGRGGGEPVFSDDAGEQALQAERFHRDVETRRAMISAAETEVAELEAHIASLRADRERVATAMATAQKVEAIRTELYNHGNGSLINLLDAKRQLANDRRDMGRIADEMAETAKKIETVKAKLNANLDEVAGKAAEQLQAAQRDYGKAAEQVKKQERMAELIDLRSPAKAMVLDLGNRSVGSVVKEGEQMVILVPLDVPVEVDAAVDPKDISHIRPGDTARIKLEAFPYQKYGTLDGVVGAVNGDVTEREEAGKRVAVYKLRVSITANHLHEVPPDAALLPGMAATCEIKVGTRRLITYFLYPIIRTLDSGLREP